MAAPPLRLINTHDRAHGHHGSDRCCQCRIQNLKLIAGASFLTILDLQLHKDAVQYDAEAALFMQGDEAKRVLFVETGRVAVRFLTFDYRTALVKFARPGDILGLASAIDHLPYQVSATAITPVRISELRTADLHTMCERHPDLRHRIETCLLAAHDDAHPSNEWIRVVADVLLTVYERQVGHNPSIPVDAFWSRLAGIQQPRWFGTALTLLEEEGIILLRPPAIIITNPEALREQTERSH